MSRVVTVPGQLANEGIETEIPAAEISLRVLEKREVILLKNVFPRPMVLALRRAVIDWGADTELAATDDFAGNYHRQRAMFSRLSGFPHIFHDYNFNDLNRLDAGLQGHLTRFFGPLRVLYNELTGNDVRFGSRRDGPSLHPQVLHYPPGGGFFGRHWHDLMPQKLGFIVSMSEYGTDYESGGTVFEIDGEHVALEGLHDLGDICVWRYDLHHWVTQSDLRDSFDWRSKRGRWVATLPYFAGYDPVSPPSS